MKHYRREQIVPIKEIKKSHFATDTAIVATSPV